jgi:two-component system response regulator MtrA
MSVILVVDDDPDIRALVALKLSTAGHRVESAADGHGALHSVSNEVPDLVVLDVGMPGISGFDVCRALRQQEATARIPILLLTARAQESDVQNGFASGADDYITKPFSPRELLSRVEAVLARSGS